ncbi:hypothetical protein [Endozoicomonas sp. GU-1]|uniref:hypothetical protein n=1 Tax=Endozoicomonas sp. GU-1 TaxID=3009078 RepID=UPI0022B588B4|nr:hypothetical protein [Endozoicomonas sp. GU-1]WBA83717.1 hypothetical protein O2T12_11670 [Endozoicomonas sp. GU-1]WBA86699.1 hypothetical protein O3276_01240 [Endozoicomonas sp. GU-1]
MKITERTQAARGVYAEALQSHKGPMKKMKALASAANCFFDSRKVQNWQASNTATITQAPTAQESEELVKTNIKERTAAPSDMQAELKSVLAKRALTGESQGSDSKAEYDSAGTKEDDQEVSVTEPEKITKQSESADDKLIPDEVERLNHQAARDKIKVRPKRRPPTRNPGRH